jgi:1,4-alpha-glucan branching enzyme
MAYILHKRISIPIIFVAVSVFFFSSCAVMGTVWESIKDRYQPYEFVGEEGDRVLVKFVFDSPSASTVWLAGQFNGWRDDRNAPRFPNAPLEQSVIEMKVDERTGYWTATIPLAPGRYEYKMVLDEGRVWQEDPNTEHVPDNHGGRNSIIVVAAGSS